MKVKSESEVAQSCPTLHHPMDCGLPGSSVRGIFQARVLEWGAITFSELGLEGGLFGPRFPHSGLSSCFPSLVPEMEIELGWTAHSKLLACKLLMHYM